jgi:class 3 adenylate cyclase
MFIWSTSQIIVLSKRISVSFKKVENYAKDLEGEVNEKTKQLREEKEKSEQLLLNVLPDQIAERLKQGEQPIADHFDEASVIFIDVVDFTKLSAKSTPQKMVNMLNDVFTHFDKIAEKYGLEKIKTIGDCYMAAAGIPIHRSDHAEAIAMMAIESMKSMNGFITEDGHEIQFRVGIDCGPIVAGVIGKQKFIYDLWGDMVNTASRMETNGITGKIQCTERFKDKLGIRSVDLGIKFEERGEIEVKGKGKMKTYFIK